MLLRLASICFLSLALYSAPIDEIDLSAHEVSLYSQNGEDGVISYLFQKIGTTSRYFVELGASDGITHSNGYLLLLQGWDSLSLDRSHNISAYNLHKEFITKDNVNALLGKYQVPKNLDLLSIKISYNAFHIWKYIDESYQPAVVVVAMNGLYSPTVDQVVLYHPYYVGDKTDYYGASILSLYKLGRTKGYSLIYAETSGHTLFFMRDDILRDKQLTFKGMNQVESLYRPATYTCNPDPLNRPFTTAEELLKK